MIRDSFFFLIKILIPRGFLLVQEAQMGKALHTMQMRKCAWKAVTI